MSLGKIKNELPPIIARSEVAKWLGGTVSPGTLANLNSKGLGPRYIKRGRKVFYRTDDLLRWLESDACFINTADQSWSEDENDASTRTA